MIFDNEIKKAKWITAPSDMESPVISRHFASDNTKECKIAISALGFFMLYVNGVRVGDEYFMPSNSMFRKQRRVLYTVPDEFTYRCYYSVYDITKYCLCQYFTVILLSILKFIIKYFDDIAFFTAHFF